MLDVWTGLEFELSVLRILNIPSCDLQFISILLGRPSSYLTKWYCTYYTDDFTAKSFVPHSTAVPEEQFLQIDVLPKINSRLFLTSELAATFTTKDEDIVKTTCMITRMWKIFVT